MRGAWAIGAVVALSCACGRGGGGGAPDGSAALILGPENVTVARRMVLEDGPLLAGTLAPTRSATLRAQTGGAVEELLVERGEPVKEGQPLIRIEDPAAPDLLRSARSAVSAARAAVALAKTEERRARLLERAGGGSRRDLDLARQGRVAREMELTAALAQLASIERQTGFARVVAPMDGIVSERAVEVGDVVQPGLPLLTVIDPRTLRLDANVPAEHAAAIRRGAPVEFQVQGFPQRRFRGRVLFVNPAVDPNTRQARVSVELPNEPGLVLAGLYAEGRIAVQRAEALTVESSALETADGKSFVLRVVGDRVERTPVVVGLRDEVAERVQILAGLENGDLVVAGSARNLADGARVKLERPPTTPLPSRAAARRPERQD